MAVSINGSTGITTPGLTNDGSQTISTGTANGVTYLNGSKVLTSGSALVFDGTNLGLGVTPSAWSSGKAIQVNDVAVSLWGVSGNTVLSNNFYYASGDKYATTSGASQYAQFNGKHIWNTAPSGTAGNTITFTQAMTLDASGNLLVGTTTGAFHRLVKSNASDYACAITNTSATTPFGLAVSLSAASPNDATRLLLQCEDSTQTRAQIRSNGGLANYSANNVNISDERTKTDIVDAGNYLAKICAIPIRTFKYKDQTDELLNLGVIAQEVEVIAPELVDISGFGETPEDGVPLKAIYQTDLQYALMKCIQEQQAIITALTTRVTALEGN